MVSRFWVWHWHERRSNNLGDRPAFVQDGNGPACVVIEGLARVDAQNVIDGRQQVGGTQRVGGGMLGLGVRGADDAAGAEAATGQQSRDGATPVIATGNGDAGLAGVEFGKESGENIGNGSRDEVGAAVEEVAE